MISGGSDTSYRKQSVVGRRMFILSVAKLVVFGGIITQLFSLQIKRNRFFQFIIIFPFFIPVIIFSTLPYNSIIGFDFEKKIASNNNQNQNLWSIKI